MFNDCIQMETTTYLSTASGIDYTIVCYGISLLYTGLSNNGVTLVINHCVGIHFTTLFYQFYFYFPSAVKY